MEREQRKNRETSSQEVNPLQKPDGEGIDFQYDSYQEELELSDDDLRAENTICVVGAGGAAFAAGVKRNIPEGKRPFVLSVEVAEDRYAPLDPILINHDARALGFPEDFPGFNLVFSYHAIPKYFQYWIESKEEREDLIQDGRGWFDYGVVREKQDATEADTEQAIYDALSEMLRISAPGGKVKIYPVLDDLAWSNETKQSSVMQKVLDRLKNENPGLSVTRFNEDDDHYGLELAKAKA